MMERTNSEVEEESTIYQIVFPCGTQEVNIRSTQPHLEAFMFAMDVTLMATVIFT
jgi:hypothetical protein